MNPERQTILEEVYRVRNGMQTHRNPSFGQHTLRIPLQDYHALVRLYPGLGSIDPVEKSAAWESFHNSPFSEPYRVGRIVKGILKNGVIVK